MEGLVQAIEGDQALDKGAGLYAELAGKWTKPTPIKNLLSGTWIGHPLHPVLTDLPIGAWGAATFLDLTAGKQGAYAARRLVGIGLFAAVPTAASGASDYADTYGAEQRVGFVHAVTNAAGATLQLASWVARRRGKRGLGIALSATGLGITGAASYLGGHLTLVRGVGVNHTAFEGGDPDWTDVAALADLVDGKPHKVTADGIDVVLVKQGSKIHALSNVCTHAGGPLDEGTVQDGCIVCPWHGSTFRLANGSVARGPASVPEPAWQVRVEAERVSIRSIGD